MAKRPGRTKGNFIGAYLDDATLAKFIAIRQAEAARIGARLTHTQVFEILINRFLIEEPKAETINEAK